MVNHMTMTPKGAIGSMEIGKKLKNARVQSGMTGKKIVAGKINVSRQTISNWENEKSYPDFCGCHRL